MTIALAKYLWRSPAVRRALKHDLWRLLWFSAVYVGGAAVSRYFREKPILDGVWAAAIGSFAFGLMWLVSAIRTLRRALREEGLLDR